MEKKHEIDMVSGPLLGKILLFALPLMCSGVLQLFFNAADLIVVGKFVGSGALAAVGATGSLINLIINVLMGFSVGTNVLVAKYYGAGDEENVSKASGTSIVISFFGGIAIGALGFSISRPLLVLMGTPSDIIGQSALYMKIYFLGLPATALFNFGAAILRSVGDTRRPLLYLTIAGILNIFLNLFFTIVVHLAVAGVALATVISQCLSTALVLRVLFRKGNAYSVGRDNLRIDRKMLRLFAEIGIPAGINGTVFSISNTLIQSSINYFGSTVIAGCSASSNIEGFLYMIQDAFSQSSLAFTSQNMGAKKYGRIGRIFSLNLLMVIAVCVVAGTAVYFLRLPILHIYSSDANVCAAGAVRLSITCLCYFTLGVMNTMVGMIRGLGYSLLPTLVSMGGCCGFRIFWIYTIFAANKTLAVLFWSYPASWTITAVIHLICYFFILKKIKLRIASGETAAVSS